MRARTEWGCPIAVEDDLDVVCPFCDHEMSVWTDGSDVLVKIAHCVMCQLNFEIEVRPKKG